MKEQLEQLVEDMLKEVRNSVDFAKAELPEVAKEYMRYKTVMALFSMGISVLVFLLGVAGVTYSFMHGFDLNATHADSNLGCSFIFGSVAIGIGPIMFLCFFSEYLKFKLQPRRMSIEAVTSLINGKDQ